MKNSNLIVSLAIALFVLLPSLCYCLEHSKATYYGSHYCKGTPSCKVRSANGPTSNDASTSGACGYGEYGRTVNKGSVASTSKLYRGGAGCGACYQIKCMEPECNDDGTTVVVTDQANSRDYDFIFSAQAIKAMAKSGMEEDLKAYAEYNITYQRVPCKFPGYNLMLKVHEDSHYPNYLAMMFLYQAGFHDITFVELYEEANLVWRACKRAYGAVWATSNPPKGHDLTVRFLAVPSDEASNNTEAKWVIVPHVIPNAWTAGALYDTKLQI